MISKIENRFLSVEINTLGSELWSIVNKSDNTQCLWQGEPSVWPRRSPLLFPFCGKLKNGKYNVDGKEYDCPMHGFIRDYEHEIISKSETSIALMYKSSPESLKNYPYNFSFYTTYTLNDNTLDCTVKIENNGAEDMYFSFGFHTGFMCPFSSDKSIEDYCLKFEKKETPLQILCSTENLLSGETKQYFKDDDTIALHHKLFSESFVLTGLKSEYVDILEKDTGKAIRVNIKDFPYVVFWSTPDNVPFVCIEPWYGVPDRFDTDGNIKNKQGIQCAAPNNSFSCTQSVSFIK